MRQWTGPPAAGSLADAHVENIEAAARRSGGRQARGGELFSAAVELATSGAAPFKRTARRYSICSADADDAYQRSLEILLTKAPTSDRAQLRPWLHTVIKHEALALRRQRERNVAGEAPAPEALAPPECGPEETAGARERVRHTAEALGTLKPNELRCLVLKALGYSYDEIAHRTGFSWTKVNRSLTEGRRRFFECFGEITSGGRCERFLPLLSAVCDGHASEADERTVRAHLSGCTGCRAALRAYRSAPARLAELVPPAVVLPLLGRAGMWSRLSDWLSAGGGERAGALGAKLQQGAEMVSAQKAAAVVASTAAIAGGGAAVHDHVRALPEREPPARAAQVAEPAEPQRPPAAGSPGAGPPAAAPEPRPGPAREEPAGGAQVAAEFGPERGDADPAAAPAAQAEAFTAAAPAAAPAAGPGAGASGAAEFGP